MDNKICKPDSDYSGLPKSYDLGNNKYGDLRASFSTEKFTQYAERLGPYWSWSGKVQEFDEGTISSELICRMQEDREYHVAFSLAPGGSKVDASVALVVSGIMVVAEEGPLTADSLDGAIRAVMDRFQVLSCCSTQSCETYNPVPDSPSP